MQTTVNIGVRLLKPENFVSYEIQDKSGKQTSNWEFWTARGELQEIATFWDGQLAHGLEQILHALAIHIESMIGLDRIHQCCRSN